MREAAGEVATGASRLIRRLWRSGPFAATGVATIALSIGAAGAVFSIAYCILLRPLPYTAPDELVSVWRDLSATGQATRAVLSYLDVADWQDRNRTLTGLAGVESWDPAWSNNGEQQLLDGSAVSYNYFSLLGAQVVRGRDFVAEDDSPGSARVVIVSDGFWRTRLGADPSAVGTSLQLGDDSWTIVGVLAPGFHAPLEDGDVWRPMRRDRITDPCGRNCIMLRAVARLRPGVTLEAAEKDLTAVLQQAGETDPGVLPGSKAWLVPLQEDVTGSVRGALLTLAGAVFVVLALACANLSNLLFLRATQTAGESAIKTALGAGRWRVIGDLVLEGIALAAVGGVIGVWLAYLLTRFLSRFVPQEIIALQDVRMNVSMIALTVALALLTGALAAVAPSVLVTRLKLGHVLRDAKQAGRGRTAGLVRSTLAGSQFVFASALLFACVLFVRSFLHLSSTRLGFDPTGLTYANVVVPRELFDPLTVPETLRAVEGAVSAAGATSVGAVSTLPLSNGDMVFTIGLPGRGEPKPGQEPRLWFRRATPGYFGAIGRKVVAGRGFDAGDRPDGRPVAIVSEAAARTYWPGEDPVGREFAIGGPRGNRVTIVGVVADAHHDGQHRPVKEELFVPFAQDPGNRFSIVARSGTRAITVPILQSAIVQAQPSLVVGQRGMLADRFIAAIQLPRLYMWLFTFFGVASVTLAAIGLYGVMVYNVRSRWREIGIKAAIGANPKRIAADVMRSAGSIVVGGVILGTALALASARIVGSIFVPLPNTGLTAALAVAGAMLLVGAVGAIGPAITAARTDPTTALRQM